MAGGSSEATVAGEAGRQRDEVLGKLHHGGADVAAKEPCASESAACTEGFYGRAVDVEPVVPELLLFGRVAGHCPIEVVLNKEAALNVGERQEVIRNSFPRVVDRIPRSDGPQDVIVGLEEAVHLRLIDFGGHPV